MSQPPSSTRPPGQSAQPSRASRPPADPVLQQRAWAAMLMALIALFGIAGPGDNIQRDIYVIAAAFVIAVVALWLATTAMARARRIGSSRPRGSVFATVLGVIAAGFGGAMLAVCALFWPQLTQFSQCDSGAGTITAQQACSQQMMNSVTDHLNLMLGSRP